MFGFVAKLIGGAAVVLAIASTAGAADQGAIEPDQISMESYSWGQLLWGWTINSDGSGELTSGSPQSKNPADRATVTKHWNPSPGRYENVRAVLATVQAYAGKPLPCSLSITDQPYGSLSWRHDGAKQAVSYDLGCRSPETIKLYNQMAAAYFLVAKWAEDEAAARGTSGTP